MIRSFCVGAIIGFCFGSSKQGLAMRDSIDGFITSLLSNDEELNFGSGADGKKSREKSFDNKNSNGRNGGRNNKDSSKNSSGGRSGADRFSEKGKSAAAVAEPLEETRKPKAKPDATAGGAGVPMDKMQELAETLNAKPTAPETDELEPS